MENVSGIHALTPVQTGILFHALEDRGDGAYVVQYSCDLSGPLDTSRLRKAWEFVVARHAALRTAFVFEGLDEPMQVVRERVDVPWDEHDWSGEAADIVQRRLEAFLESDRLRGFDVSHAPLMRVNCFRFAADRYHMIWTYHHITVDGWSSVLVLDDVWRYYQTPEEDVSPPPPSFGDFVTWSRTRQVAEEEEFWRKWLAGAPLPTTLTFAHPPAGSARLHARERIRLSANETRRLRDFATSNRLTLSSVVHGAWALTLARCSGTGDIVYGATVAGRPATMPDVDRIVGAFINTLPVRTRTDENLTLVAWLTKLQDDLLDVRDHELSSLQNIARWTQVPASDLFDMLLVFENAPPPTTESSLGHEGIRVSHEEYFDQSNYGFALLAHPLDEMDLHAVFKPDYISPESARRLLQLFVDTLLSLPDRGDVVVGSLGPPLGDELDALNGPLATDAAAPSPIVDVLQLFLDHARTTPHAPAIVADGDVWSYEKLHNHARHTASRLRKEGVVAGDRVAIMARKGPEFVSAVLATLGCNAAYVPLEPEYPAARLALIIKLSEASIVLTDSDLSGDDHFPGVRTLSLGTSDSVGANAAPSAMAELSLTTGDQDAYIIFTSGSTGVPKGVVVSRANLAFSTAARTSVYGTLPPRFLLLSPIGFDSSVAGLFWPLSLGGTLIISRPAVEKSPRDLARTIVEHGVTTTLCVPSFYQLLLEQGDARDLQGLNTVTVAGEACPPDLVQLHSRQLPHTQLINEYGPTECTVWSTYAHLGTADSTKHVPIGRPIPGATVRVLDRDGRPVPIGTAGELCVSGPGVARGYVNLPNETALRFTTDPASPGSRMYRTGDMVRMDANGVLTFLGRNDTQLKIRGFRIEPHEIESALRSHPAITEAVVVPRVQQPDTRDQSTIDPTSVPVLVRYLEALDPAIAHELLRSVT